MFQRIDLLPLYDPQKRQKVRERWDGEGRELLNKILEMIREGAGEDFLQWDFEQHRLGFLEDQWDQPC